jgi:hypothetical protein
MERISGFVTAQIIASQFHVTPPTVLAWARRGWVPCLRAGHRPVLFNPLEVEAALRSRAKMPSAFIEAVHGTGSVDK